jgi:hypothetical protein
MPNTLKLVESQTDLRTNIQTFNAEASHNRDRALSILRGTTYWVYDSIAEQFGPSKFVGFERMTFDMYEESNEGHHDGASFDGGVAHKAVVGTISATGSCVRRERRR